MEPKPWNSRDIAFAKNKLDKKDLDSHIDGPQIREMVKSNAREAEQLLSSFPKLDQTLVTFFNEHTLGDGSIDISDIKTESKFFQRKDVSFSIDGGTSSTRGYSYICSLDVALTSIQKIKKYQEIVYATLDDLKNSKISKLEKMLLLDYLKNSLITILNSFIYQEKLGSEKVDVSKEYEEIRTELMSEVGIVINKSMDLILDKDQDQVGDIDFDHINLSVGKAVNRLGDYHHEHRFPSFYVSRPEASHPFTIVGASVLFADRHKKVGTIVGLPSGATELAFTTKYFMDRMHGGNVELVLLPMSLHSLKNSTTENGFNNSNFAKANIKKYFKNGSSQILICDDNTSSGRTLQLAKDLILEVYPDKEVYCSVAEADIVRSQIDKDNEKRTHVANKDIYNDAVDILPVSKSIAPKIDLKEVVEKKKIISYYKKMEQDANNLVDKLYGKIMAHVNERGADYSSVTEENAILAFRGTFLSNFYAEQVELNGKKHPSVEHAYQAAKFGNIDWNNISIKVKNEIREALKLRGYAEEIVYDENLFLDTKMAAGNTKIIADIFRKYHYVDKDWENKRIKIMIGLLIQKFRNSELSARLAKTGDKELIEGNTWDDTLWGVTGGHGRNMLGVALMEIRDMLKKEQINDK